MKATRYTANIVVLMLVTAATADAPSLRVATYNVWGYRGSTPGIVALVDEIGPDVLCLQEGGGSPFVNVPVTIPQGQQATVDGVWIASVHLSTGGSNHYSSMLALLAIHPGGPGIIAGDFNERPDGRDVYGVAFDLLAMHALAEAGWVRVDTPVQPESTLPLTTPGCAMTHGCGRLDQIWVTPDIRILACGIPPAPWYRDGQYLSDHAPVWAEVAIPEPATAVLLAGGLAIAIAMRRRRR